MNGQQSFDCLQFENQLPLNDKIQPISTFKLHSFILNRQRNLPFECKLPERQFVTKTFFISRLQQPRTETAMNFNARTNYLIREFIESPRLRVSAVNM
jgi:hypothetical protein